MDETVKKEELLEEELSEDELDMVAGGAGIRHAKKEKTVDASSDTLSKI